MVALTYVCDSLTGAGLWDFSQVVCVKSSEHQDSCWGVMMEKLILLNFYPCTNKSYPRVMGKVALPVGIARIQVNRDLTSSPRGPQAESGFWAKVTENH